MKKRTPTGRIKKPETIKAYGAFYVRSDLIGAATIIERDNEGQMQRRVVGPAYFEELARGR